MLQHPHPQLSAKRSRPHIRPKTRHLGLPWLAQADSSPTLSLDLNLLHRQRLHVVMPKLPKHIPIVEADVLTPASSQQNEQRRTQRQKQEPAEESPAETHPPVIRSPVAATAFFV